jgi:hypothetical protein
VIETSPPGVRVPPPGTVQQRAAPPPFYMNHQQLQMLQYLQEQNSVNLTPQQQVSISYLHLMALPTPELLGLIWVLFMLQFQIFLFFQISFSRSYSCMLIFFSCLCLSPKVYNFYRDLCLHASLAKRIQIYMCAVDLTQIFVGHIYF